MSERDIQEREEFFKEFGEILVRRHGQNYSQRKKTGAVIEDEAAVNFGRALRQARARAALSPEALAAKTGLSKARIIALESGLIRSGEIKSRWVKRLAQALGVEVETFEGLLRQRVKAGRSGGQFSPYWLVRGLNAVGAVAIIALLTFGVFAVIQHQFPEVRSVSNLRMILGVTDTPIVSSPKQMVSQAELRASAPIPTSTPAAPTVRLKETLASIPELSMALAPAAPTETSTPSPTLTATGTLPPTPMPRPTSTPEAVVIVPNLNLRAGPGVDYDRIGSLVEGDILDVQGRIAGNDWLAVSDTELGFEGWVSAAPEYVQINGDLRAIPTVTPPPPPSTLTSTGPGYPAPIPISPDNGAGVQGTFPPLVWAWERELGEDEFFEVRIWHESLPYHAALGWVKQPQFDYQVRGERSGKYFWAVAVVRGANPKPKDWTLQPWWPYPMWDGELVAELSPESEPRFFLFTAENYPAGAASAISEPPTAGSSAAR
ncbi:MAG TPA: helix-turn-helix domain-containing protein [Anaerolineae bacterium]|jgi:cytoskeletal protein RodZ